MEKGHLRLPVEIWRHIISFHQGEVSRWQTFSERQGGRYTRYTLNRQRDINHVYRQLCRTTRGIVLPILWEEITVETDDDVNFLFEFMDGSSNYRSYLQHVKRLVWECNNGYIEKLLKRIIRDYGWNKWQRQRHSPLPRTLTHFFASCTALKEIKWEFGDIIPIPQEITNSLHSNNCLQSIHLMYTEFDRPITFSTLPTGWKNLFFEFVEWSHPEDLHPSSINYGELKDKTVLAANLMKLDPTEQFGMEMIKFPGKKLTFSSYVADGFHCPDSGYRWWISWLIANILNNLEFLVQAANENDRAFPMQKETKAHFTWQCPLNISFNVADLMYFTPTLPIFLFALNLSPYDPKSYYTMYDIDVAPCVDALEQIRERLLTVLMSFEEDDHIWDQQMVKECDRILERTPQYSQLHRIRDGEPRLYDEKRGSWCARHHAYIVGTHDGMWFDYSKGRTTNDYVRQIIKALIEDQKLRQSVAKTFFTLKKVCLKEKA